MLCTNAIAPAIIEPLVAALGWSVGFQLAALAALIAAFVARGVASPPRIEAPPRVKLFELLDRRALCIYYTSALTGLGFGTLVTYTQTGNENMQAVNSRLGYVTRDVSITVHAPLPLP